MENLLTRKETADYLGLKPQTLAAWAVDGRNLPYYKVGRLAKYKMSDILAYLDQQRRGKNHLLN